MNQTNLLSVVFFFCILNYGILIKIFKWFLLLLFIYNSTISQVFKDFRLFFELVFNLKIEHEKNPQSFLYIVVEYNE